MAHYVIDHREPAAPRLWYSDRDADPDFESEPVIGPACDACGAATRDRVPFDACTIDPTDQELADLPDQELARFGFTAAGLRRQPGEDRGAVVNVRRENPITLSADELDDVMYSLTAVAEDFERYARRRQTKAPQATAARDRAERYRRHAERITRDRYTWGTK